LAEGQCGLHGFVISNSVLKNKYQPRKTSKGKFQKIDSTRTKQKSGPTDHLPGKPINREASQSDRLKRRDKIKIALAVPSY
jgi:hypothetical protein